MTKILYIIIIPMAIMTCNALGSATAEPQPTARDIITEFRSAGLDIQDVQPGQRQADSPLPNSYKEHLEFTIPEVAPSGGQIFVCDTKRNCDALFAYFDGLRSLAGPYLYQSPSGLVVVQLNSGLSPETGADFEAVVSKLP